MKQIIMRIPSRGLTTGVRKVEIEAEGFKGQGCSVAVGKLAAALGEIEQTTNKPEFDASVTEQNYVAE
jgi:hypothetical protein